MGLLASVRMNSHYVAEYASPGFGEFRRRHADCLIGRPDEHIPAPSVEHAIHRGVDYRFPAVREHMEDVVCELFERFDVDGVELDYMRHPAFFRVDEGLACGYLMTDFLRRIRRRPPSRDRVVPPRPAGGAAGAGPPEPGRLPPPRPGRGALDRRRPRRLGGGRGRVHALRDAHPRVRRRRRGHGLPRLRQPRGPAPVRRRARAAGPGGALLGRRRGRPLPVQLLQRQPGVEAARPRRVGRPRGAAAARQALPARPLPRRQGGARRRLQPRPPPAVAARRPGGDPARRGR